MTETTTPTTPTTPPPTPVKRLFTATLIQGVSGSGKTTVAATLAEYLWETYRKVVFFYSWDGGAIPTSVQKLMRQGLIRFWRCRSRSMPGRELETIYFATKGYVPRQINAETGETTPGVDLVAPMTTLYTATCPHGHVLKTVTQAKLIAPMTVCVACKNVTYERAKLAISETVGRTRGMEDIGGVIFDGLTSMTGVVMEAQDLARGEGHIGGEKSSFGGVVKSGSVSWGGNNRADVGFAQSRAGQFVANSLKIPYLLEGPVFTGLSTEGTDKGGLAVVGVELPGSAALTQAPAWFGNITETGMILDDQGRGHYALYLRPYIDKDGRRHLLKTTASSVGPMPDLLIDPAIEERQPNTVVSLGTLYKLLDEDLRLALETGGEGRPGIPVGVVEYGDEPIAPTATGQPTVAPMAVVAAPKPRVAKPLTAPTVPTTAPGAPGAPVVTSPLPAAAPRTVASPVRPLSVPTHGVPPPPGMRPPARLPQAMPSAPVESGVEPEPEP